MVVDPFVTKALTVGHTVGGTQYENACSILLHLFATVSPMPIVLEIPTSEEIAALRNSFDQRLLDDAAIALEAARRTVEAAIVDLTRHAEATGAFAYDGHRGVIPWMTAVLGTPHATSVQRARCADLPIKGLHLWTAAFANGSLGVEQAAALARVAANPRVKEHLAESEHLLLGLAQTLPYKTFTRVLERWVSLADANGTHRDHESEDADRWLTTSVVGHRFILKAECGTAQGTVIKQLLDEFIQREYNADAEAAIAERGHADSSTMARTSRQRALDALVEALGHAASADTNTVEPVVNLTCDMGTFVEFAQFAAGGDYPTPDPLDVGRRRCDGADGQPIDPQLMIQAAITGRIRAVMLDDHEQPIRIGPKQRFFDRNVREAIRALDITCYWPGCEAPASHAHIDHVRPHHRGGTSEPANAGAACAKHNMFKSDRWYARKRHGGWVITRANGSRFSGAPPSVRAC